MLVVVLIVGNGEGKGLSVGLFTGLGRDHVRSQFSTVVFDQDAAFFPTTHQTYNQYVLLVAVGSSVDKQASSS